MSLRNLIFLLAALWSLGGCAGDGFGGVGSPSPARNSLKVAEAAYSVGDYAEAARLYERASAAAPRSAAAMLGLGRSYGALGQFARAKSALDAAEEIAPRDKAVKVEQGHLQLMQMRPESALGHYEAALKIDRRDRAALAGRGVALDYLSRHREAQQVYREALAIYPTDFPLLSDYALSKTLSGDIGEGIALMEQLLRDPVKGRTVRLNMALAYALDGREADARAMMRGDLTDEETERTLAYYREIRRDYRAGKPIGYLVFR